MSSPQDRAIAHVSAMASGGAIDPRARVTLHFQPDRLVPRRRPLGPGERIFGSAYDTAPAAERPKLRGAELPAPPARRLPRFGFAHPRPTAEVLDRSTFCYPDRTAGWTEEHRRRRPDRAS